MILLASSKPWSLAFNILQQWFPTFLAQGSTFYVWQPLGIPESVGSVTGWLWLNKLKLYLDKTEIFSIRRHASQIIGCQAVAFLLQRIRVTLRECSWNMCCSWMLRCQLWPRRALSSLGSAAKSALPWISQIWLWLSMQDWITVTCFIWGYSQKPLGSFRAHS